VDHDEHVLREVLGDVGRRARPRRPADGRRVATEEQARVTNDLGDVVFWARAGGFARDADAPEALDVAKAWQRVEVGVSWVDFGVAGVHDGSLLEPGDTLTGGTVRIEAGGTAETITITPARRLASFGGEAVIGG